MNTKPKTVNATKPSGEVVTLNVVYWDGDVAVCAYCGSLIGIKP